MNKKDVFLRNVSLLSIFGCLLFWIFPFPPFVWRIVLILVSLYAILRQDIKQMLLAEKLCIILSIIFVLYFILNTQPQGNSYSEIGNMLCALLPIPLFKYLTKKNVLTEKTINILIVLLLICSVFFYFEFQNLKYAQVGKSENVTINASGLFLSIIPLLFTTKNNIIKFSSLLVCSYFLIIGAKRGNILASIIPIILLFHLQLKDGKKSLKKTVLFIIITVGFVFIIYNWIISNEYLLYRFERTQEGDSSQRDIIYNNIWNLFTTTDSMIQSLFGYGYNATSRLVGSMAHSDWLEILIDFGIFGVVLYAWLFLSIVFQIRNHSTLQEKLFLVSCLIIWMFKSIYSMFIFDTNSFMMAMCIGIALGKRETTASLT